MRPTNKTTANNVNVITGALDYMHTGIVMAPYLSQSPNVKVGVNPITEVRDYMHTGVIESSNDNEHENIITAPRDDFHGGMKRLWYK